MERIEVLSKLQLVRENEKKSAQIAHTQSVELFEEIAKDLYKLLKKKETAEDSFLTGTNPKMTIETIREQATYIENLNKSIGHLQSRVNQARLMMEKKQGKLTDAHVEVKKIEKMIEFRKESRDKKIRKQENDILDEVSIQQYLTIGE